MIPSDLSYRIEQPCTASAAVVYRVLADVEHWPDWMPGVRSAGWEHLGNDVAVHGAIRRFSMRGLTTRERIVTAEPPHHQAYTLLSGMPVKNYRADIYIDDRPAGCLITWQATFESRIPLLGNLIRAIARSGIASAAAALAQEAQLQA